MAMLQRKSAFFNIVWSYFLVVLFVTVIQLSLINTVESSSIACTEQNNYFLCNNHRCIWKNWVCDGEDDCKDNSDELDCKNKTCNSTTEFKCNNGYCVSQKWVCDGQDDCKDNSDESDCEDRECTTQQFTCAISEVCIPSSWKCDGERDCVKEGVNDTSDEDGCEAPSCDPTTQFRCNNGDCIKLEWKCDSENDCSDASDESQCPNKDCTEDEFRCNSGKQCIPEGWKCDDESDCYDHSDEANCHKSDTLDCPPGHFQCKEEEHCILESWVCDGDEDCDDGSDEAFCSSHCEVDEYACDSHHCVNMSKVCDGWDDCEDKSDEAHCHESGCNSDSSYLCSDNLTCIIRSKLCDGRHDCPGGDDEDQGFNKCSYDECAKDNGNCSQICTNLEYGYKCSCHYGYELDQNKLFCNDTNECEADNECEQICINEKGSYKCECYKGYKLEKSGKCKLTNSAEVGKDALSLVFSDKFDIRRINLDSRRYGKFMSVIAAQLKYASGLALHVKKRLLFWTDLKEESIYSMSMEHTPTANRSITAIVSGDHARSPAGLAVDWINDHLYWTDIGHSTISVSYTNGSYPTTIVKLYGLSPRSIALHPGKGYMFVSEFGTNNSGIFRYGMNGKVKANIVTTHIKFPTGLAIDYEESRLFWVDAKLHLLASCDLDGTLRKTILQSPADLMMPFGIALHFDTVYWTDKESRKLQSCNKWNGKSVKPIDAQLHAPLELQVDHPRTQPNNFVAHCLNHTCQLMCLPALDNPPKQYTCVCPNGFVSMLENSDKCVDESFLKPHTAMTPAHGIQIGTKLAIAVAVIGGLILVLLTAFGMYRWNQRRSAQSSINFDNPVYRKTTTTSPHDHDDSDHPVGIPRNNSEAYLIQNEYQDGDARRDSQESDASQEHVYEPVSKVSTEADDSPQAYNSSDKKHLVS